MIIVLSCNPSVREGTETEMRLKKGLAIYNPGDKFLLLGGVFSKGQLVAVSLEMRDYLMQRAVPEIDILVETISIDTCSNISEGKKLIPKEISSNHLVTSVYHIPRSCLNALIFGIITVPRPVYVKFDLKTLLIEVIAFCLTLSASGRKWIYQKALIRKETTNYEDIK